MIWCSCRAISDRDYASSKELFERIMEDDAMCGSCQDEIIRVSDVMEKPLKDEHKLNNR
jgi:hypothetical protein